MIVLHKILIHKYVFSLSSFVGHEGTCEQD